MNLLDVNVLVYAVRQDADRHQEYRSWLMELVNGDAAFGLSEQVLAGVLRIVTHPRVFKNPSPFADVIRFVDDLLRNPLCRIIRPSERHWHLFVRLCEDADARGNLIMDAWHAALAIESGCTWITTDRDFARFPGLRWRHPLQ